MPKFSMVAYTGDAMRVDGWRNPVVVDLQGLGIPSQRRPIRFGHSMHAGVGHTERITVEGGKLVAEGLVSRDTPALPICRFHRDPHLAVNHVNLHL